MLARLQASQTDVAQKALSIIEPQLTSAHLTKLHDELLEITPLQLRFMDRSNAKAIHTVKQTFLRQASYFKHLTDEQLITYAQQPRYHRDVMIALIRKFTIESQQADPFATAFSYALLDQAGVEQNYLYLSRFIDQCNALPWEKLQAIGRDKSFAIRMLQDISNTQHYFTLSVKLLAIHPSLANQIANAWQYRLETIPLTKKENSFVQKALPTLQKKHRAFQKIKLHHRALRNHRFVVPRENHAQAISWLGTLGAGLSAYALPQVTTHAKSILALSTALFSGGSITTTFSAYCATSLPILMPLGVYTAIAYVARRRRYTHR